MDKKHLYEINGTGTNSDNEITLKVDTFVDDICENFPEYVDAELELYIVEEILSRFCYRRIKKRIEIINKARVEIINKAKEGTTK